MEIDDNKQLKPLDKLTAKKIQMKIIIYMEYIWD